MRWSFIVLLALTLPAAAQPAVTSKAGDDTARVKSGDAAMAAAMQKARAGLNGFLALADKPRAGIHDFSVKIGVKFPSGGAEYLWIRPFTHEGDRFVGTLVNTPEHIKGVKHGDRISFAEKDIADWSYFDGPRRIGNYTACAVVAAEPPAQRQAFMQRYNLTCEF